MVRSLSDQEFPRAFSEAVDLLGTDRDVANLLCTSVPNVTRWKTGRSLPYPHARAFILATVARLLAQRRPDPREVVTQRERNRETLECFAAALAGAVLVTAGLLLAWVVTS
jgi:hypothetical protein